MSTKSSSSSSSVVYDLLPDDLIIEILSRLPAKSVGRLRCLSKTWHTRLSSREFVDSHLCRRREISLHSVEKNLIMLDEFRCPFYRLHHEHLLRRIELPGNMLLSLVGHCRGLVLFMRNERFCLLNPVTKQQVMIPHRPANNKQQLCGFGYVDRGGRGEYKIVSLDPIFGSTSCVILVYSSKTGAWKDLGLFPNFYNGVYQEGVYGVKKGVFSNGAIHWLTSRDKSFSITAFDLADEVFHKIPLPSDFTYEAADLYSCHFLRGPFVLRECLCIVKESVYPDRSNVYIWLMKDYGNVDSWTRLSSMTLNTNSLMLKPLYCSKYEEEVLVSITHDLLKIDGYCLWAYNLKMQSPTDGYEIDLAGLESVWQADTFLESLVSPNEVVADMEKKIVVK